MRVLLLRHGESEANAGGYISDDPSRPVALTARGRAQAAAAARALADHPFVHAYASEHLRAQQTAQIVLAGRGLRPDIDARLNERRSGMDGLPVETFNGLVRDDPAGTKPPLGESFLEQMERMLGFLDAAASRHPGGLVLAVSHENPILAARALAGLDPQEAARGALANCTWIELDWPVRLGVSGG